MRELWKARLGVILLLVIRSHQPQGVKTGRRAKANSIAFRLTKLGSLDMITKNRVWVKRFKVPAPGFGTKMVLSFRAFRMSNVVEIRNTLERNLSMTLSSTWTSTAALRVVWAALEELAVLDRCNTDTATLLKSMSFLSCHLALWALDAGDAARAADCIVDTWREVSRRWKLDLVGGPNEEWILRATAEMLDYLDAELSFGPKQD